MCWHQALDPQIVAMIEPVIVSEWKPSGHVEDQAPDLTQNHLIDPSVTLVFDREGWSPK